MKKFYKVFNKILRIKLIISKGNLKIYLIHQVNHYNK